MLLINCKNYDVINNKTITKLAKITKLVSKKYKIKIAIAPPNHLLISALKYHKMIFTQHMDNIIQQNSTGFINPNNIKNEGIIGTIINHSEHKMKSNDIIELILKLHKMHIISVICIEKIHEIKKYVMYNPDYIAIESKELIGTGKSITHEKPDIIVNALKILKNTKTTTKLLCGAGISTEHDVKKAIKLGTSGVLISSGIIKSKNWNQIINKFAKAML